MTAQEHLRLNAERQFLKAQISELPETAKLTRSSFESRLRQVELLLSDSSVVEREPAAVRLTFSGRPVVGSHGIFSDFGMKAVNSFTEAVAAVAASLTAPLAAMGPIPNRLQNQMLITGTALGSFGFELEEAYGPQLTESSIVSIAIERTQSLLRVSSTADDEGLADIASELDQRAIDKIRSFVGVLEENGAVCTLQHDDSVFRFQTLSQVSASLARLSHDNLHEREVELYGEFQGVIPQRRAFQFLRHDTKEILLGKVGPSIIDANSLNKLLYTGVTVRINETRVGNGKPRNLLVKVISNSDPLEEISQTPPTLLLR